MAAQRAEPAAEAPLPPLVAVTGSVSPNPEQLFMATNNPAAFGSTNESLFYSADGALVFRLENKTGLLVDRKTLYDGQGNVLLRCKKTPLSLAKWTIRGPGEEVLAKSRTVPGQWGALGAWVFRSWGGIQRMAGALRHVHGLAKYGVEVIVPSRSSSQPTFLITPDMSLRHVILRQVSGKGKARQERLVCDAAFGPTVVMGWMSALSQNWSYLLALEPGADAALMAVLLAIFTDLLQWEALEGFMGMGAL
ncbi:hypothetical protein ABPG75_006361 [Micractinium tetrahymenae]